MSRAMLGFYPLLTRVLRGQQTDWLWASTIQHAVSANSSVSRQSSVSAGAHFEGLLRSSNSSLYISNSASSSRAGSSDHGSSISSSPMSGCADQYCCYLKVPVCSAYVALATGCSEQRRSQHHQRCANSSRQASVRHNMPHLQHSCSCTQHGSSPAAAPHAPARRSLTPATWCCTRAYSSWTNSSSSSIRSNRALPSFGSCSSNTCSSSDHSFRPGQNCSRSGGRNSIGGRSGSSSSMGALRSLSTSVAAAALTQPVSLFEELQQALVVDAAQSQLTPAAVVERLDRVIVGQEDAKKAVAVAFRNRWRRQRVTDPEMRGEITPKNLLLIGPTGCGKTEIARRLAKLAEAPFVKVEATKFTEVGYHGRDVDSIMRDLVEAAHATVKQRWKRAASKKIAEAVEAHVVRALLGEGASQDKIEVARQQYRAGELDDALIELDVPGLKQGGGDDRGFTIQGGPMSMSISVAGMFGGGPGGGFGGGFRSKERRTMSVAEARPYLEEAEAERQLPAEMLQKEAVRVAEQEGIVFIDEIDKIVNPKGRIRHGSDPSAEGVQRDLLPLIEGSTIQTKHGPVSTDHVLFIASGAFTTCKPSDMMAELQGRLPIRVELKGLKAADFERVLTQPEYNMVYQQQRLLACDGVELVFTPDAISEIARLAEQMNNEVENIGARRLHTVLERLVEDISFEAPDKVAEAEAKAAGAAPSAAADKPHGASIAHQGKGMAQFRTDSLEAEAAATTEAVHEQLESHVYHYRHVIDAQAVQDKLAEMLKEQDLSKYIL